jgi:antitoxin PrlF
LAIATLTSKGQTTIPKRVREHLQLSPGDKLDFVIEPEGHVVIRPAKLDVRALKGMLQRTDGKVMSLDEMNAAIAAGAARRK